MQLELPSSVEFAVKVCFVFLEDQHVVYLIYFYQEVMLHGLFYV